MLDKVHKIGTEVCFVLSGDEVSGLSVSIRDREDILQIWNTDSELSEESAIITKVKDLLPSVTFSAIFYKGMLGSIIFVFWYVRVKEQKKITCF